MKDLNDFNDIIIHVKIGDRVVHSIFGYSEVLEINGKVITLKPVVKPKPNSSTVKVIYDHRFIF